MASKQDGETLAEIVVTLKTDFTQFEGCCTIATSLEKKHLRSLMMVERFRTYLKNRPELLWDIIDKHMVVKTTEMEKKVVLCDEHLSAVFSTSDSSRGSSYCMSGHMGYCRSMIDLCKAKQALMLP